MPRMATSYGGMYHDHDIIASSERESHLLYVTSTILEIFSYVWFFVVGLHMLIPTYTYQRYLANHGRRPVESLLPVLYTTIVSLFVLPLVLRRWPTYAYADADADADADVISFPFSHIL